MQVMDGTLIERWSELTDDEIVRRVSAGQTGLFELLMRRHNERVYRAARAIVRDEHEAEDVMQQAYVNAYVNLRQFAARASFSTWLTRIVVNEALARVRRQRRFMSMEPEQETDTDTIGPSSLPPSSPEAQAYQGELRAILEAAVDRLPDGAREVFVLREVQGLSTAETAEILDIREDAVKTRLSRARHALRKDLLEGLGSVGPTAFRFYQPRCDRVVANVMARIG
jgi:RNA polymerase sigma-70 factor (ECF subfamily)